MSQKKVRKIKNVLAEVGEVREGFILPKISEIFIKGWKVLLLAIVLVLFVYLNSLNGDFVSDDYASITQNPNINNISVMFNMGNTATITTYFTNLLFGFNSAFPFHFVNIIWYVATIITAYVLLVLVTGNYFFSNVAILLFSVHPIHAESVSWISGRIYLIIAEYVMLSLIFFIKYLEKKNNKLLILSILFFVLGFLTDKPRPFSIFLLVILYTFTVGFKKLKINTTKFFSVIFILLITGFLVAIPYINYRVSVVNSGYNQSESVFYNPFFQYPTGISKYLQLLLIPIDLTLYHTMFTFPVWLNWLILIIFVINIIYFYFKNKYIFFSLGFLIVSVLPSIAPVKVSWLVAERYMYLGSLGFCLFLAIVIEQISKKMRLLGYTILFSLIIIYSFRTFIRNNDWSTNHKLWVNTCQVSPNSHNAWNNIGDDYDKLGDYTNAIKGFTQSVIVKPNYADAYHNRANIFYKVGRLDMARDSYNVALTFSPSLYQTYLSLTQIDLVEKKHDLAMAHIQQAIQLQPENIQNYYLLSVIYAEIGKKEEAVALLKQILSKYPDYQLASDLLNKIAEVK